MRARLGHGSTGRGLATLIVVSLGLAWSAPAGGTPRALWRAAATGSDVTTAEVAELLADAVDDDAALSELADVETVDGTPVELGPLLPSPADDPSWRRERLSAVSAQLDEAEAGSAAVDPEVSDRASEILDGDKFHESSVPRPLAGPLEWLGERFSPVVEAVNDVIDAILDLPGGWLVLLLLVLGPVTFVIAWLASRVPRTASVVPATSLLSHSGLGPSELDALAAQAEADGDLDAALRYTFEAGLLRLVRLDRLELRDDTTASSAARQVGGEQIAALAHDFEEVVYGPGHAEAETLVRARQGWAEVLGSKVAP